MQIGIQRDSVTAEQSTVMQCRQMTSSVEHGSSHWGLSFSPDLKDQTRKEASKGTICAKTLNEEEAGTGKD